MTYGSSNKVKPATGFIDCAGRLLSLEKPGIMGVLNITPDSFSDGGRWLGRSEAIDHAMGMQQAGADIIDIGGESTRPGADMVPVQQELDRVIPVIEAIASQLSIPVSIDTSKAEVMREAVAAGAGLINDVCALRQQDALETAVELGVPVCLMHMLGNPRVMQHDPAYTDVGKEVTEFLLKQAARCQHAGIPAENILLDPGFGFGKTLEQNIELFRYLPRMAGCGYPLLVGVSRKSMIGQLTGRETAERLAGSVAAAVFAIQMGAAIIRVHDVAETRDAFNIAAALFPAWA